jgi:hypothetical protein
MWSNERIVTVVYDGYHQHEAVDDLVFAGIKVGNVAIEAMYHPSSEPPVLGKRYRMGIIHGNEVPDGSRTLENVRMEATRRGWVEAPMFVNRLLRLSVSDETLEASGLAFVTTMHKPVVVGEFDQGVLLSFGYGVDEKNMVFATINANHFLFERYRGFAFLIPEV